MKEASPESALNALWDEAADARWNRPPVWVHGDVSPGNLILRKGRLAGVIDFGQLAIGDPACDLAIAWRRFDTAARRRFRDGLDVDNDTWARGRAWALWKAAVVSAGLSGATAAEARAARHALGEILNDDSLS